MLCGVVEDINNGQNSAPLTFIISSILRRKCYLLSITALDYANCFCSVALHNLTHIYTLQNFQNHVKCGR